MSSNWRCKRSPAPSFVKAKTAAERRSKLKDLSRDPMEERPWVPTVKALGREEPEMAR